MEKALVFLVDDYDAIRRLLKVTLGIDGHKTVLEAKSLQEALEKVPEAKKLGVNVAVVDGWLDSFGVSGDGSLVAQALRKEIPSIKIISFSASPNPLTWGDYNVEKLGGERKVVAIIRKL